MNSSQCHPGNAKGVIRDRYKCAFCDPARLGAKRLENPARPAPADALRRIKPAGACPPLKRQEALRRILPAFAKPWRRLRPRSQHASKQRNARAQGAPHEDAQRRRPATVAAILAYMPEIGAFAKAGAACMAGLAPINDDSGKLKGPRHIEAGRAAVRKALYMAALVAISTIPSCASSPINLNGTASLQSVF